MIINANYGNFFPFCYYFVIYSLWEKYKNKRQLNSELQEDVGHIIDEVYNKCLILTEDALLSLNGGGDNVYNIMVYRRH